MLRLEGTSFILSDGTKETSVNGLDGQNCLFPTLLDVALEHAIKGGKPGEIVFDEKVEPRSRLKVTIREDGKPVLSLRKIKMVLDDPKKALMEYGKELQSIYKDIAKFLSGGDKKLRKFWEMGYEGLTDQILNGECEKKKF